jgi:hypothetical protein
MIGTAARDIVFAIAGALVIDAAYSISLDHLRAASRGLARRSVDHLDDDRIRLALQHQFGGQGLGTSSARR